MKSNNLMQLWHQVEIKVHSIGLKIQSMQNSTIKAKDLEQSQQLALEKCIAILDGIENYVIETNQQYDKLERILQQQETQIRKHIGIEQQLKLYSNALKIRINELELQKQEIIMESKRLREADKRNESYNTEIKFNKKQNKGKFIDRMIHNQTAQNQCELHRITKTQLIQRPTFINSPNKQTKNSNNFLYNKSKDKSCSQKKKLGSKFKKRKQNIFSNYSLITYLSTSKKKKKKSNSKKTPQEKNILKYNSTKFGEQQYYKVPFRQLYKGINNGKKNKKNFRSNHQHRSIDSIKSLEFKVTSKKKSANVSHKKIKIN